MDGGIPKRAGDKLPPVIALWVLVVLVFFGGLAIENKLRELVREIKGLRKDLAAKNAGDTPATPGEKKAEPEVYKI